VGVEHEAEQNGKCDEREAEHVEVALLQADRRSAARAPARSAAAPRRNTLSPRRAARSGLAGGGHFPPIRHGCAFACRA
jgi:hypothetical protein